MRRLILTLLLSCLCVNAFSKQESGVNFLRDLKNSTALNNAVYSVYAKYVGGKNIIAKDENILLTPASVLKLFTTASALEILGPDTTFETKIYLDGKIKGNTIQGDIYLVGGGDPSFGSKDFKDNQFYQDLFFSLATALKQKGITYIKGNIYADNSLFSGMLLPWYTSFRNVGNYYAPKADALSIANNKYKIVFPPVQEGQKNIMPLFAKPEIKGIKFKSYVNVSSEIKNEDVYATFEPASNIVNLNGTLPITNEQTEIYASLPNPAQFAAESFLQYLEYAGIKISGKAEVKKADNYSNKKLLFTNVSPSLKELVKHTNKKSDNLYAEVLIRDISAYTGGDGTVKDGLKKQKDALLNMGLSEDDFDISDASGLSYSSNVSCKATVTLLEKILAKPYAKDFKDSLVIAGNEGEKGFFGSRVAKKSFAGKTLLKTGLLDKSRTVAGYTKDKNGKDVVFCFFINNFKTKGRNIIALQDKFLTYLADYKK
ncbi:MAG: D-alanyl-D-alanine carboxypeptidase/D-alanyl-D-alanine-endopeptidase [Elusimicrobiaceae bacterium]|nr:D-alanyl-D-alanine carboxypeptidase/D-alanyl-D-alanine-endopeptidase [Elusimicrobiaceae bacterium]